MMLLPIIFILIIIIIMTLPFLAGEERLYGLLLFRLVSMTDDHHVRFLLLFAVRSTARFGPVLRHFFHPRRTINTAVCLGLRRWLIIRAAERCAAFLLGRSGKEERHEVSLGLLRFLFLNGLPIGNC